jgi:hypothetical protein
VLQVSIDDRWPDSWHHNPGRELLYLRRRGVVLIGSGIIVHNPREADFLLAYDGFNWAVEADQVVKAKVKGSDHRALCECAELGIAVRLAIPKPDHYYPLVYVLATQTPDDKVTVFKDALAYGSVTMPSVRLGPWDSLSFDQIGTELELTAVTGVTGQFTENVGERMCLACRERSHPDPSPGIPSLTASARWPRVVRPGEYDARQRQGHPVFCNSKGNRNLTNDRSVHTIAVSGWWVACVGPPPFSHFSEAIMKAILSMALVLGACGLASAVDNKAVDPVGTWKCEYEIGGQQRTATLTIKKDGDKLAGTMSWPDQKEEKVKDLKLTDSTLAFSVVRKFMDNEITVEYKLAIDGDKLKGKGAAEFGGEKREFDIEAKREQKNK